MNFAKYNNNESWGLPHAEKKAAEMDIAEKLEKFVGTRAQYEAYRVELQQELRDRDEAQRILYNRTESELVAQFWVDAFASLGIPLNHPKADVIKRIAWDKGHSAGLSEVYSELSELSELII